MGLQLCGQALALHAGSVLAQLGWGERRAGGKGELGEKAGRKGWGKRRASRRAAAIRQADGLT